MKKITKLKICDWTLLPFTLAILISSIQLEVSGSATIIPVAIHIILGLSFFALIIWHIFLHFGWSSWFVKFHKQKNVVTKILWWLSILTLLSALIALFHWIPSREHSPIGGVHGKIGFLMIIFAIGHICKRIRFFKKK